MTNYNERLEEILGTLNSKAREERASCIERNNWEGYNSTYERLEYEAKQAINSLTKELVAEAKPEIKAHPLGPVTLADCQRGLNHYEANLLKALEEV